MEEKKTVKISKRNFTGTVQDPPLRTQSRRRKFSNVDLCSSSYFKLRALVRQLRPQFIQILQTPDFKNSKAAHELRIQMNLVMDLYKRMITMEADTVKKIGLEHQPLSGQNVPGKQSWNRHQDEKVPELHQFRQPSDRSAKKKPPKYLKSKIKRDDVHDRNSYIVGGSVFGWNFVTFGGSKPVYYGVTKESFRKTLKSKRSGTGVSSHYT
ncbi:hypothetical protein JCGZ_26101 [Jatropha curcas]|uniref:Uncharacterized protein n=1 Tax=Jatropha curcas TaxID=180498 RepID=A0A067JQK7_JATCU|nr:uncharacterized protein LOC105648463 isoform X3 [Jatropha curcas]KDP22270.1 hypothetical protein JCGZ_26101 [Jatropha curcas]